MNGEVFAKIKKNKKKSFGGRVRGWGSGPGGVGLKFLCKFKKKLGGGWRGRVMGVGSGRGVRVDVNGEVKFFVFFVGGRVGGEGGGGLGNGVGGSG